MYLLSKWNASRLVDKFFGGDAQWACTLFSMKERERESECHWHFSSSTRGTYSSKVTLVALKLIAHNKQVNTETQEESDKIAGPNWLHSKCIQVDACSISPYAQNGPKDRSRKSLPAREVKRRRREGERESNLVSNSKHKQRKRERRRKKERVKRMMAF